jgi:hypothetical protein
VSPHMQALQKTYQRIQCIDPSVIPYARHNVRYQKYRRDLVDDGFSHVLYRSIACSPEDYQQATLWAVAHLSDDTRYDISESSQYSSENGAIVDYRSNLGRASLMNRVRPLRVGSSGLFATFFSFRSETLTIDAVDQQPAAITAIRMQVCPPSRLAPRNNSASLPVFLPRLL